MRRTEDQEAAFFDALVDALSDMVNQHCSTKDGQLDSYAISANANAMRLLAELGKIKIESEAYRRVVGRFV